MSGAKATDTNMCNDVTQPLMMATFLQIGPPGPGQSATIARTREEIKIPLQPDHCLSRNVPR